MKIIIQVDENDPIEVVKTEVLPPLEAAAQNLLEVRHLRGTIRYSDAVRELRRRLHTYPVNSKGWSSVATDYLVAEGITFPLVGAEIEEADNIVRAFEVGRDLGRKESGR